MKLETIKYNDYINYIPKNGRHILALQPDEDSIIVYQAFNKQIADYAVQHQKFGGSTYNPNRMTWIKPNFLWMMYRSGWGTKENQERTLAIQLTTSGFNRILENSVFSSFQEKVYSSKEEWSEVLQAKEVRLQWDPDHDIFGAKQERKAIQLGLKGKILEEFNNDMIVEIIDITPFVSEQKKRIDSGLSNDILVPKEKDYLPMESIQKIIGING